jgi:hypothetical protein
MNEMALRWTYELRSMCKVYLIVWEMARLLGVGLREIEKDKWGDVGNPYRGSGAFSLFWNGIVRRCPGVLAGVRRCLDDLTGVRCCFYGFAGTGQRGPVPN